MKSSFTPLIRQQHTSLRWPGLPLFLLGSILIYSVLIPTFIIHMWVWCYEAIFFRMYNIPRVRYRDFVVLDRHKLKGLNVIQKLACLYCGYVNGTFAWLKAVANMTEVYSCAIKHSVTKHNQEHQQDFYDYATFES